jgi:type IV secretory pathway TrbF-like protein
MPALRRAGEPEVKMLRDALRAAAPSNDARESEYTANRVQRLFDEFAQRIAMVLALCLLASLVMMATMYVRSQQPLVYVDHEAPTGQLIVGGVAQASLMPDQAAVAFQLATYIKARRDIPAAPNGDYSLAQRNIDLTYFMSVDAPPYHERQTLSDYYAKPENNPKMVGKDGETRTVLDPVVANPLTNTVWSVSWFEQSTTRDGVKSKPRLMFDNTLTIAPPHVQVSSTNEAGVYILAENLKL